MDGFEITLSIIIFCMATFLGSWLVRKIAEYLFPSWLDVDTKWEKFWRDVVLPVVPAIVGAIFGGAISSYPYPEFFYSIPSRVFFGVFCGLVSGLIYRIVRSNLKNKLELTAEQEKSEPKDPFSD